MKRILVSGTEGKMEAYEQAISRQGMICDAIYAPIIEITPYDGLVLCGGGDFDPRWYGADNEGSRQIDLVRERSDVLLVCRFARAGKPILGICRGMQLLNVVFGGTLRQDLGKGAAMHQGRDGTDCSHTVTTRERSMMRRLYGDKTVVNSNHHQAIERVGYGFRVTMTSEDGVAEALEHRTRPILAVQWHPERMPAQTEFADGDAVFQAFSAQIKTSGTG